MIKEIFHEIYALNLSTVICIIAVSIIVWSGLGVIFQKRMRLIGSIIVITLLIAVLYNTVFSRSSTEIDIDLIPLSSFERAISNPEIYRSMLMNVFLFVPLGLSLPYVIKGSLTKRIMITVLVGFVLSVSIETIQFLCSIGMVETDDVICNTFGTLIGSSAYPLSALGIKTIKKGLTREEKG